MTDFILPIVDKETSSLKSVRIKNSTLKRLEETSNQTNLSVNKIINECIEFALDNLVLVDSLEKEKINKKAKS